MENVKKPSAWDAIKAFFQRELVSYCIKRILLIIPSLFLISFVIFFVIQLPPGDAVSYQIELLERDGEPVDPDRMARLRRQYNLDDPYLVQYFKWVGGIIWTGENTEYYQTFRSHHNWMYSMMESRSVWDVIEDRLATTIIVTLVTIVFQYLIAIPIAVYSATHQYSIGDYTFSILTFVGSAIPGFIFAILCMYLAYKWTGNALVGLFSDDVLINGITWQNFPDVLKHMIIPMIVLGFGGTCGTIRSIRAQMLDELSRPYTLTARAKGVKESTIVWKYCFRCALNPTVSGFGGVLSELFSGSTVTAMVLNLQMQGPVLYSALKSQDMYLAGAIVMIQAVLVEVGILLADIGLAFLDPRIRFSGGTK